MHKRTIERPLREPGDFIGTSRQAFGGSLGRGNVVQSVSRPQVDDLQHCVDGTANGSPRATTPPWFVGYVLLVLRFACETGCGCRCREGSIRVHFAPCILPLPSHRGRVDIGVGSLLRWFGRIEILRRRDEWLP